MEIIKKKIEELIPYEFNAKLHPEEQIEQIKNSIVRFKNNDPIAIDCNNVIIEGHGRYQALMELGYTEVECIILDLTEEEAKAYRLVHNQLTMNTDWDMEMLKKELSKIELDMSFFGMEELLDGIEEDLSEAKEDDFDVDAAAESIKEPTAKLGDVYQLGNHRLMCGDSTSIDDVEKLMNGHRCDLLITDPPYNVDYEGTAGKIQNDSMKNDEFHQFLYDVFTNAYMVLKDGGCFYVWYASREVVNFQSAIEEAGLTVKQELIWNKNSLVIGRQDYQWKHEPCLYGWKETASHNFYGDRKQTTVIDWDRPTKSELHPTMKPVGLFDYQIKNSSKKGDIVLDLFGGSGTTIVACEQNGRTAYSMEYDPKYVDVIIKRWETLTGGKAELING